MNSKLRWIACQSTLKLARIPPFLVSRRYLPFNIFVVVILLVIGLQFNSDSETSDSDDMGMFDDLRPFSCPEQPTRWTSRKTKIMRLHQEHPSTPSWSMKKTSNKNVARFVICFMLFLQEFKAIPFSILLTLLDAHKRTLNFNYKSVWNARGVQPVCWMSLLLQDIFDVELGWYCIQSEWW